MEQRLITLNEAAEIFGISAATMKNWVKLGKIRSVQEMTPFLFDAKEVYSLLASMDELGFLKSRRNKSRQNKGYIPRSYISSKSPNYKLIRNLINNLQGSDLGTGEILAFYAGKLLEQAKIPLAISKELLKSAGFKYVKKDPFLEMYEPKLIPLEDTLGLLYLSLRALKDRKSKGAYYTPFFAVDKIISVAKIREDDSILDPSCGTGNFLLRLPDSIPLTSIHGYDIDEMAVSIARINLAIAKKIQTRTELNIIMRNICKKDFLFDEERGKTFDVILGNPPWGYSYSIREIELIKAKYNCCYKTSRPESFSLFVERALLTLNEKGNLAFLLPEAILATKVHTQIRKVILEKSRIKSITYLGDIFHKVQCPCVILKLGTGQEYIDAEFCKKKGEELVVNKSFRVSDSSFLLLSKDKPYENFNVLSDDSEIAILNKMNSIPHFTLEGNADFALGIVTGANNGLISENAENKSPNEPIIRGNDIEAFRLKKPSASILYAPSKYQQMAPEHLYRAKEKLVYRFISDKPVFALDSNGYLSLNSANILIPKIKDYDIYYILGILNSSAIAFYYAHTCRSVKVLRSALESLPIPACGMDKAKEISLLTKKIIEEPENKALLEELNEVVSKLYGVTI